MRNRNKSVYVIDGDAKEVKELYELMKDLGSRKEPFIKNGFGTKWLGCMVDALGKERKNRDVSFIGKHSINSPFHSKNVMLLL